MSALTTLPTPATGWLTPADCDLAEFRALVEQPVDPADYPYAERVEGNVVFYGPGLRDAVATREAAGTCRPNSPAP